MDFSDCGACDEYGHPIECSQCIHKETCTMSSERQEPCIHRFDIINPRCLVCSGSPKGECENYEPE